MELVGTLTTATVYKQLVKSPVITIRETLQVDLHHNDVPVTLYYKHGNYQWRHLVINNAFDANGIPRYSDVYLMCSVDQTERVEYAIRY